MKDNEWKFDTMKNSDDFSKPEKIVTSIDYANGEDMTACVVAVLDTVGKAFILAAKVFSEAVSAVQAITETLILAYPNKRVVYLAQHHKKARIRKKNQNRILKWMRKEGFKW